MGKKNFRKGKKGQQEQLPEKGEKKVEETAETSKWQDQYLKMEQLMRSIKENRTQTVGNIPSKEVIGKGIYRISQQNISMIPEQVQPVKDPQSEESKLKTQSKVNL